MSMLRVLMYSRDASWELVSQKRRSNENLKVMVPVIDEIKKALKLLSSDTQEGNGIGV